MTAAALTAPTSTRLFPWPTTRIAVQSGQCRIKLPAIVIQRYLEIDGQLRRATGVVKLHASQHSKDLREYEITSDRGIIVGQALRGYDGLLTGAPARSGEPR
jgi:KaiC/GvpD/RAD55 family RecA-like ATPase